MVAQNLTQERAWVPADDRAARFKFHGRYRQIVSSHDRPDCRMSAVPAGRPASAMISCTRDNPVTAGRLAQGQDHG